MVKAVFMDYYGTVAHENGPIAMEVVKRIYKNSSAGSPEGVTCAEGFDDVLKILKDGRF